MPIKVTTFYRPEDVLSLLAETRAATVLDMRVADEVVADHPEAALGGRGGRPREREESQVEYAVRLWSRLLPSRNGAADMLDLRCEIGWTLDEIWQIKRLLRRAQHTLLEQTRTCTEVSRDTLVLNAQRINDTIDRWAEIERSRP